ncbi:FAD/NAD(P)-binding protein, partial [Campylobacter coli]
ILKLCSQDISIHIVKEYAQCIIQQEKYFIIFFIKGPNFYEFLLSKGYKADKNGYYSRVLLGKYLEHSFQCILKLCSQDISIHIVKEYAQCIIQQEKYFII